MEESSVQKSLFFVFASIAIPFFMIFAYLYTFSAEEEIDPMDTLIMNNSCWLNEKKYICFKGLKAYLVEMVNGKYRRTSFRDDSFHWNVDSKSRGDLKGHIQFAPQYFYSVEFNDGKFILDLTKSVGNFSEEYILDEKVKTDDFPIENEYIALNITNLEYHIELSNKYLNKEESDTLYTVLKNKKSFYDINDKGPVTKNGYDYFFPDSESGYLYLMKRNEYNIAINNNDTEAINKHKFCFKTDKSEKSDNFNALIDKSVRNIIVDFCSNME